MIIQFEHYIDNYTTDFSKYELFLKHMCIKFVYFLLKIS